MGFLRQQMGEEELRTLLEMLRVEAGAWGPRGGGGGCRRAPAAAARPVARCPHPPRPPGALLGPIASLLAPPRTLSSPCLPLPAAGKDGGIDVNRLMELADAAEEEEEEEGRHLAEPKQ